MTIIVKPAELAAISFACSTEETRYYLRGVNFEIYSKGFAMIATDGHRLHSLGMQLVEVKENFILPIEDIKRIDGLVKIARKAAGRKADIALQLKHKEGKISIKIFDQNPESNSAENYGVFESTAIDGTFPDVRRVIPSRDLETAGLPFAINGRYMAQFAEVSRLLGGGRWQNDGFTIHAGEVASDPIMITIERTEFLGVLMPIRRDI